MDWAESRTLAADPGGVPRWFSTWLPLVSFVAVYGVVIYEPSYWGLYLDGELGAVQLLQLTLLAAALFYGLRILALPETRARVLLRVWAGLMIAGTIYVLGEEASWGQFYFGWGTPDWLIKVNKQNETNLHNISSWFNQRPRSLFELGIVVGGILRPLWLRLRPPRRPAREALDWRVLIWPASACIPAALLVEACRGIDMLNEYVLPSAIPGRHSETQEFFMYYFVLVYAFALYRRIRSASSA